MARLAQQRKHDASIIAHSIHMNALNKNVAGMNGVEEYWLKELSANDRALVKYFREEMARIPADLKRMMEEKRNGTPS